MRKKLKKPSDYPQFYCRMSEEDKEEIEELIESILTMAEELQKPDEYKLKRNQLVQHALKGGLKVIEKRYKSKISKK
jgi:hypothetical protein